MYLSKKIYTKKKSEIKSLTTVSLDNIILMDQSMDYILYGFQILEELTLQFCYGHRRVVLLNSNLKTLVLGIRWFVTRTHVSCPTLLSLNMFETVEVRGLGYYKCSIYCLSVCQLYGRIWLRRVQGLPREENIPPNYYGGQMSQATFLVCCVHTSLFFTTSLV